MLERKVSPSFWFVFSFFAYIGLWFLIELEVWKKSPFMGIGSILGVGGYFLFSLSLLLSSRWRRLEDWLGGLDRIYHLHRQIGVWGFALSLIHPWAYSIRWVPHNLDKFFLFAFPIHGRLSVNLGAYAYWLMIIILGITLLKLLSYDKWKNLHKFMSIVFVLATLHIFMSERKFDSEWAQPLLLIPTAIGFFGILYKQVLFSFLVKQTSFEVIDVKNVNDNVVELTLKLLKGSIQFIPGQYGFFSFNGPNLTKESHPFTLIETSDDSTIIILIKARGDFTKNLFDHIKKGYTANLQGYYGRFYYNNTGDSQIWIAGGIGIVPFIAWERALKQDSNKKQKIDLYYCVHRKEDAIYFSEFQDFSRANPDFHCHLHCAEEDNRINVEKIQNSCGGLNGKKILMCGPIKLTQGLKREFQKVGVKKRDIYFENFEFF